MVIKRPLPTNARASGWPCVARGSLAVESQPGRVKLQAIAAPRANKRRGNTRSASAFPLHFLGLKRLPAASRPPPPGCS